MRVNERRANFNMKFMDELSSMVHINFENPKVTVFTKDSKLTKEYLIGNIGGTFGVFIGFSFVGLLDSFIVFFNWISEKIPIRK